MAGLDLTTADKILKVLYLPPVRELLNNATILLNRIEKDSSTQQVGGKNFTIPIHNSRNQSAGVGRAEDGTLPTAGQQGYLNAIVPNKYIYGSIRVTGPVLAATRSSANAFVEALNSEMKGLVRDTRRAVNRQLHSDGIDALGYIVSGAGSTSIVIDDDLGNVFSHFPAGDAITVDLLDKNDSYNVEQSAFTVTRGAATTGGYNATAGTTLDADAADGDPLVVTGTKDNQMMGIAGIISATDPPLLSGGLHGLTVAANPKWIANVVGSDASPVDLNFPLIQQAFSELAINSDFTEEDIKFLLMSYAVRDKFVELCTNERQWYNTGKIDGGFEAVTYNGKPWVPDSQCRRQRIYGIVPETLKIYRSSDFDWMDRDGAILTRDTTPKDAYSATLFHYGDLGCSVRNGNFLIAGVND